MTRRSAATKALAPLFNPTPAPAPIALRLAELDYLLSTRVGIDAAMLLDQVADGAYHLESFGPEHVHSAIEVINAYRDLEIGLADASIVVIAARASTNRVLTLDERHFRALRPLAGGAFELLP